MLATGTRGAPGDYAASIGTTGLDYGLELGNGQSIPPNGAFRAIEGVRFAEILDGLSNTLLVGEKHVPLDHLSEYPWDCSIYDGHNPVCRTRPAGPYFPLATSLQDDAWKFGSYHQGMCGFVFCDGSVRPLMTNINPVTLGLLAQRNDGQVVTAE